MILLKKVVDEGIKQVIILGAGFNTRSIRMDFLDEISFLEIDHPDTANLKIKILTTLLNPFPKI